MDAELEYNLINRVAVGDLLRRRARDSAQATAVIDYTSPARERFTFDELNKRANKFGRVFRRQGAKKGDRICILTPNCNDIAVAMYGCFKAGMVYVPLNYMMSEGDLGYVVNHAEPACAVIHPSLVERWLKVLPGLGAAVVNILDRQIQLVFVMLALAHLPYPDRYRCLRIRNAR